MYTFQYISRKRSGTALPFSRRNLIVADTVGGKSPPFHPIPIARGIFLKRNDDYKDIPHIMGSPPPAVIVPCALLLALESPHRKRLQAWAVDLSGVKRSIARGVKAEAPPEVVGAHLRFLSRTGSWERLLVDIGEFISTAESDRDRAVDLLRQRCDVDVGRPGTRSRLTGSKTSDTSTSRNRGSRKHRLRNEALQVGGQGVSDKWVRDGAPFSRGGPREHPDTTVRAIWEDGLGAR